MVQTALGARGDEPDERVPDTKARAAYSGDTYSWAIQQAGLIRQGRFDEIDIENVAEEIESVGRSERSSLRSYLARLMQHMLKWDHQPDKRTPSWRISIRVHRRHAARQLRENPGLKGELDELLDDAYGDAVLYAIEETGLAEETFPRRRPYSREELLDGSEGRA